MPQVDVEIPAHLWRLRPEGIAAAGTLAARLLERYRPTRVAASLEPKATETGSIVAKRLRVPFATADGLHEHDRRAAGFLGRAEFATRMSDLFAHPDEIVFGAESAAAALTRFEAAVDQVIGDGRDEDGDVVVVSHGTVISLFVAKRAHVDATDLWATLGLPSYVALELPNHRIIEIIPTI
ncbi:MAG: histidine phosphatase family protein [Chloroflexota bacterium]